MTPGSPFTFALVSFVVEPAVLAQLWQRHASGLSLFARVRCSASAEDLVQEAFIRLARQESLPKDPLAWLARAVRNLAVDAVRSDARRRKRERLFGEHRAVAASEDDEPAWTAADATAALVQLEDTDRDIVIAHLWNSMTFRQIAEAFSMSSSTVNRRYLSALKRLKSELENGVEDAGRLNPQLALEQGMGRSSTTREFDHE